MLSAAPSTKFIFASLFCLSGIALALVKLLCTSEGCGMFFVL